jgi:hypothetical protein
MPFLHGSDCCNRNGHAQKLQAKSEEASLKINNISLDDGSIREAAINSKRGAAYYNLFPCNSPYFQDKGCSC